MKILRNILAVIAGLFVGGLVNMGIVTISGSIIPPPEGVDTTTVEGLKEGIHLFEFKHFIMPFLAHALGTFVGAFVAALLAVSHQLNMARIVGVFFLIGGIMMVVQVPSPLWFSIVDLALAYIPMACIGGRIIVKNK